MCKKERLLPVSASSFLPCISPGLYRRLVMRKALGILDPICPDPGTQDSQGVCQLLCWICHHTHTDDDDLDFLEDDPRSVSCSRGRMGLNLCLRDYNTDPDTLQGYLDQIIAHSASSLSEKINLAGLRGSFTIICTRIWIQGKSGFRTPPHTPDFRSDDHQDRPLD